jgi:hypothetical protein
MLIVGGTAALTAIAVYLAWHFFNAFRSHLRERKKAARMIARAEAHEQRIDVHEPTH